MRCWGILLTLAAAAGLAACNMNDRRPGYALTGAEESAGNRWMADHVRDAAVAGAILRQHTLYPYHFQDNTDQLNALGQRDLNVLVTHYRNAPGPINVRRGETPEALYDARVNAVRKHLTDAGLDTNRIALADADPGGSGMASERVVRILSAEAAAGEQAAADHRDDANQLDPMRPAQGVSVPAGKAVQP